ncbi:MAG TPA: hypothetical protein VEH03_00030, partial [Burkholderiales bacterium]|nr:hypothetical protein [Burkholderiales bacterium]
VHALSLHGVCVEVVGGTLSDYETSLRAAEAMVTDAETIVAMLRQQLGEPSLTGPYPTTS